MARSEYYVAAKFARDTEDAPIRAYSGRELAATDRIFSHLANGGIAVVSGDVGALDELLSYVIRREKDLGKLASHELPSSRLMVKIQEHSAEGIIPPYMQRHLMLLCGEAEKREGTALVPYKALIGLQTALVQHWQVDALGAWLQTGDEVLAPRSQETYRLFRDAITAMSDSLPEKADILDMGCGCGVLAFIAARELSRFQLRILATDVLPEAVGSTKLNLERLEDECLFSSGVVQIAVPSDLFASVKGKYDLVIFNAPWVLAPVRSRVDVALNDEKQRLLARFFTELPNRLKSDGRLILGYADNSGEKAIQNALKLAADTGFSVSAERSQRVATHRKRGKWERIYVWEMQRSD